MSSAATPTLHLKQTLTDAQIAEANVPKSVFDHEIVAMKMYYTSERAPTHPYTIPFSITNRTSNTGIFVIGPPKHLNTAKENLQLVADSYKDSSVKSLNKVQTNLSALINQLNADKDMAAFDAELERLRQQAIADATANINQSFKGIQDIGHQDAANAAAALAAAQKIGQANASIMASISRFFKAILSTVIAALAAAVAWVAQAAQDVANWVAGAVSTVVDWVSNLF